MNAKNDVKKVVAFDFEGYSNYLVPAINKIIPKITPLSDVYEIEKTDYLIIDSLNNDMFPTLPADIQMRSESISLNLIDKLPMGVYVAVLADMIEQTITGVVLGRIKEKPSNQSIQLWKDNPARSVPQKTNVPVSKLAFLFKVNWYRSRTNPL